LRRIQNGVFDGIWPSPATGISDIGQRTQRMKRTIEIGTAKAAPGSVGKGYLKIGSMALIPEVTTPVLIINGRQDGPTLWLNGAVHGQEINAFVAMRNISRALSPDDLAGAIIMVPFCNPLATQFRSRGNPFDGLNLDQQFPGRPDGSYSERNAHILLGLVKENADYLISFHATFHGSRPPNYTVYKTLPEFSHDFRDRLERFVLAFGAFANCHVDLSAMTGELPGGFANSICAAASQANIPGFMAEIGGDSVFMDDAIDGAEKGIYNVLRHLGMIEGAPTRREKQIIITKRCFFFADHAGFLRSKLKGGEMLKKGEEICRIVDLFDDLEVVHSPSDSYLILLRHEPVLHFGDPFAALGLEWHAA
jgi:predicted deacylase